MNDSLSWRKFNICILYGMFLYTSTQIPLPQAVSDEFLRGVMLI